MQPIKSETIWDTIARISSESVDASTEMTMSSVKTSRWLLEERAGFAKIAGMAVVPSQFMGVDAKKCREILTREMHNPKGVVRSMDWIKIPKNDGSFIMGMIINDDPESDTCIVYNNPNGVLLSEYFSNGVHPMAPISRILAKSGCPMIVYDYWGTGINKEEVVEECSSCNKLVNSPSVTTIAADGLAALTYAMRHFKSVSVWGSSLGGGVATISCEAYLAEHPDDAARIKLFNHDSFTTTGEVALNWPLSFLASLFGGQLDAATAMKSLANRKVRIMIICHDDDPVIPARAQMRTIAETLGDTVTVVRSSTPGHAYFCRTMQRDIPYYA